jgi:hypothetical protein
MKRKRSISTLPSTSGVASNIGSQQSQVRQNETRIQCKGCPKEIEEKSILLHLRSKRCKQHYSDNEYSDLITKRDQARKLQQKRARLNPEPHTAASNIVVIDESSTITIDQTNVPSHSSQQSQSNPDSWIKCKGCPKKILENSMLLHLRSKNCRKHYSDKDYSDLITRRDERRKLYKQELQKSNKSIQKKNTASHRQTRMNSKSKMTHNDQYLAFKRDIVDGPNFVCFSCNRNLFKCSVKILETKDITKLLKKMNDNLVQDTGLDNCHEKSNLILCHSCNNNFNYNKFPSININNGLKLDDVPQELSSLADLEQQLIAQVLLFMKIKKLPTTRMGSGHQCSS